MYYKVAVLMYGLRREGAATAGVAFAQVDVAPFEDVSCILGASASFSVGPEQPGPAPHSAAQIPASPFARGALP